MASSLKDPGVLVHGVALPVAILSRVIAAPVRAELKCALRKRIDNRQRKAGTTAFFRNLESPPVALLLDQERRDCFAILHGPADLDT